MVSYKAGLVPYCEDFPPVRKKRGGPATPDKVFPVLPPPTEEEEKSFGTKDDVRELGNCSADILSSADSNQRRR